ncbi:MULTISPECIES: DUF4426 domain-containing protein [Thalassolituus]|jgi:hypothetical protein|uniref:DUF4426 domain-containing protein n=3 Tax=root TaxID=1 RepID=M5DWU1_9GAMM|nr:DUF4426 domain-containing protein [Thalassolituus oleivorans]PHQ83836.1 MAG: DUF4426 domain-containing protein [Thalassobium sp.]AHK16994.1 homoserine O-acetyltransferase [Thalassolituus oleivorans R6-15]APR68620.1 hypothetical protein CN03_17750 [Thalassolituus oleivorans]MDF1640776.1 DUF4426 domain-containing protein [Thalassolituus oleivorans]PHQ87848.1 MAG: DUF4426 domain-containing protein [Thalassobium sp.]|tara:strand:+ start:1172 stop:1639 length:468 start_codon:yes stop_codon:yes gene_type:complete
MKLLFVRQFAQIVAVALVLLSAHAQAADTGEQKKVFGEYEVHYIGLNSSFLPEDAAAAYNIPRSRSLGYLSISILKDEGGELAVPVSAKLTGTIRNLIGQVRELEFREIKETNAVYYISTFRFDDKDMYTIDLKATPEGQPRTFDVTFSQQFYQE